MYWPGRLNAARPATTWRFERYLIDQIVSTQRHQMAKIDGHPVLANLGVTGLMTATNVSTPSAPCAMLTKLFAPAERMLLGLVAALCVCCVASAALASQAVDWPAFFPAFGASLALVILGAHIRATRHMPRMALGAIGFGVFMSFTGSIAIFIYTLFPLSHPLMDQNLIAIDAAFGFSWLRFVEFIAAYPIFGKMLHYVYLSILPQVVCVIILLSFMNRAVALHRFLSVGILCMIFTVGFWWLFPSVGPAAFGMVSQDVAAKIGLLANADYGAEMRQLAAEGIALITPARITGVIAFPSFHIVMACMVVWFTRGTFAFVPLAFVNVTMMPAATIVHGGHHLIDLFGGLAAFAICQWVATKFISDQKADLT